MNDQKFIDFSSKLKALAKEAAETKDSRFISELTNLSKKAGFIELVLGIREIKKYHNLNSQGQGDSIFDFSIIKDERSRRLLETNQIEMMRFRFGSNHDEKRFVEYCRYAYIQLEVLITLIICNRHIQQMGSIAKFSKLFRGNEGYFQMEVWEKSESVFDDEKQKKVNNQVYKWVDVERRIGSNNKCASLAEKIDLFYDEICERTDLQWQVRRLAKIRHIISHDGVALGLDKETLTNLAAYTNLDFSQQNKKSNPRLKKIYDDNDHHLHIQNLDYLWADSFMVPLYQYYKKYESYF